MTRTRKRCKKCFTILQYTEQIALIQDSVNVYNYVHKLNFHFLNIIMIANHSILPCSVKSIKALSMSFRGIMRTL